MVSTNKLLLDLDNRRKDGVKLIRWETAISDFSLDFKCLIDQGPAKFQVETSSGILFEVILDGWWCGPYVVVDEEHLTNYWSIKKREIGSTFIVEPSNLLGLYEIIVEPEKYKHYVVATSSSCLEVLSHIPPGIRRVES